MSDLWIKICGLQAKKRRAFGGWVLEICVISGLVCSPRKSAMDREILCSVQ